MNCLLKMESDKQIVEDRKYDCLPCGKSFKRKNHLKVHRETVHEGKKKMCPDCGLLWHPMALQRHINNTHSKDGKISVSTVFKCY